MKCASTKSLDCSPHRFLEDFLAADFTRTYYEELSSRRSVCVQRWDDVRSSNPTEGLKKTRTVTYLQSVPQVHADALDPTASRADTQWATVSEHQQAKMTPEGSLYLHSTATLTLQPSVVTLGGHPAADEEGAPVFGSVVTQWIVAPRVDASEKEGGAQVQYTVSVAYKGRIRYLSTLVERSLLDEAISALELFWSRITSRLRPPPASKIGRAHV